MMYHLVCDTRQNILYCTSTLCQPLEASIAVSALSFTVASGDRNIKVPSMWPKVKKSLYTGFISALVGRSL